MYRYEITFLGGNRMIVTATSPRQAQEVYTKLFNIEVINVRWLK